MEQDLFSDYLTSILLALRVKQVEDEKLKEGKVKEENPEKINQEEDNTIKFLL